MGNPFELLSLTARPWVEPEVLQARFRELASLTHPDALPPQKNVTAQAPEKDRAPQSPRPDFAELNAAKRDLENPVLRLKHLLEREAPDTLATLPTHSRSASFEEQFLRVATLLREASAFREQQARPGSAVQRAVLQAENATLLRDLDRALAQLDLEWRRCESQIRALDGVWERRTPEILRELALIQREMSFLQKWRSQLREARLQLSS